MYAWLWRHFPGNTPAKVLASIIVVLAVLALLYYVVFPFVEPRLPFGDVTVDAAALANFPRR